MNIMVTHDYGDAIMADMRALGYAVTYVKESEINASTDFSQTDIFICYNPFQRMSTQQYQTLTHIILSSTGIDQLPAAVVDNAHIKVTHNRHGYAVPIGEWIVMMLLVGLKNLLALMAGQRQKQWKMRTDALEMSNKRIVFVGTGNIAEQAIARLKGFSADIWGVNRTGHHVEGFAKTFAIGELAVAVSDADAVVNCLPETTQTHHLFDDDVFNAMRDDAIFINISRGSVIDQTALVSHLSAGEFRLCALDVVDEEPLSQASPLWDFPQVVLTPHNSWISEHRNARRLLYIMENLRRIKQGDQLLYEVDPKRGY